MSNEYRVFGPPGTGKTTYLKKQVERDAERYRVMVCSLTRTAAAEIAGRKLPIPRECVGTLHSYAYRAVGCERVADTPQYMAQWNEAHPALRLGGNVSTLDEYGLEPPGATRGDQLYSAYQILRHKLVDRRAWPASVQSFAERWDDFKRNTESLDFTDLIEIALQDVDRAPGEPESIIVDEAQDLSKLCMSLVRKWGEAAGRLILAGDDDQCLYAFAGATPDAFIRPAVPEHRKCVLSQSHRVPRAVHALAQRWVKQLRIREPKEYAPRDADGIVRRSATECAYLNPRWLVRDVCKQLDAGRTVMILATCSYMLAETIAEMRAQGVPFHNPFRPGEPSWNPLGRTAERLLAYLRPSRQVWGDEARWYKVRDVADWIEHLQADGLLQRGVKTALSTLDADAEVSYGQLIEWLVDINDLEHISNQDLNWYREHLLPRHAKSYEYPLAICTHRGGQALREKPRCIVGTVHSVKGGEADVVYVYPDLSPQAWVQYVAGDRDSIIRTMYVAITRAREELVLCHPVSQQHVRM